MRFVKLETYLEFRKKLDLRVIIFNSSIFAVVAFLFLLLADFLAALIVGILVFVFLFGFLYLVKNLANRSVDSKREKVETKGNILEVTFEGEPGLLMISDTKIKFVSLVKMSHNKEFENEINEDLFIGINEIKYRRLQKYRYGSNKMCHITVKEMPHGIYRGFYFFDIDGTLEKVTETLDKVNCFNLEKHQ